MQPNPFEALTNRIREFVQEDVLTIAGTEGIKQFRHHFQKGVEGFEDDTLEKWAELKPATLEKKRRGNGSMPPILTGVDGASNSGQLRDSLRFEVVPGTEVRFITDVPYAQRHNEGLNGMPKRPFMGPSATLDRKIAEKIDRELHQILSTI